MILARKGRRPRWPCDWRGTGNNIFCGLLLGCLELLFNLDDLTELPDGSEAERPDGVELGEELREDVFIRVDRRVGRVARGVVLRNPGLE